MKYKILPRRVTLLVYGEDSANYTAACQININGKHGTLDTLIGSDFYALLSECGYKPFRDLGLVEVSAAVTEPHLKLLRRRLKDLDIEVIHISEAEEVNPGLILYWVRMTEKKPVSES